MTPNTKNHPEQVRALQPHPDTAVPRAVPQRRERVARSAHGVGKDGGRRDSHHAHAQRTPGGEGVRLGRVALPRRFCLRKKKENGPKNINFPCMYSVNSIPLYSRCFDNTLLFFLSASAGRESALSTSSARCPLSYLGVPILFALLFPGERMVDFCWAAHLTRVARRHLGPTLHNSVMPSSPLRFIELRRLS